MRLRLGFFILGITTVMAFTGCSSGEKNAEKLIEKAQGSMSEVTSLRAKMDMYVKMKMSDEEISTVTTADIAAFVKPLKMKIDVSSSMESNSTQKTILQMYVQEEGKEIASYANAGTGWYRSKLKEENLGQFYVYDNLIHYLATIDNVVEKGEEKIGDVSTFRIEGVLKGETMEKMIKESGILSSAQNAGISEEEVQEMLTEVNSFPITLWIDKDGLVYQYEVDMSKLMQLIINKSMELIGVAESEKDKSVLVQEAKINMVCSEFNQVQDFQIPEEALLAKQ